VRERCSEIRQDFDPRHPVESLGGFRYKKTPAVLPGSRNLSLGIGSVAQGRIGLASAGMSFFSTSAPFSSSELNTSSIFGSALSSVLAVMKMIRLGS
jgi:hypothetical protein